MAKRILVAGGAGFIGSHLVDQLSQQGNEILIFDNLQTGRLENIHQHLSNEKVHFEKIDIREPLKISGPIDEIYNLASPASPADFSKIPIMIMETAAKGHQNLLELALQKSARILLASTSEVYGDPLVHPQSEEYYGNVNPIGIRSCYDEAKRFAEALSMAYVREKKSSVCIARIFNTYGPRMRIDDGRIIPNFFAQALAQQALTIYGDGRQTRSYCYVTDMVRGLIDLMESNETGPVNLGGQLEASVNSIAEMVNQLTKNKSGVKYLTLPLDDPKLRRPDLQKAKAKLHWAPKVSLNEGLSLTLRYFTEKDHRNLSNKIDQQF